MAEALAQDALAHLFTFAAAAEGRELGSDGMTWQNERHVCRPRKCRHHLLQLPTHTHATATAQVLTKPSLEWACWLVQLMVTRLGPDHPVCARRLHDARVVGALRTVVAAPLVPYGKKRRVRRLLVSLLQVSTEASRVCVAAADAPSVAPTQNAAQWSRSDSALAWQLNKVMSDALGSGLSQQAHNAAQPYNFTMGSSALALECELLVEASVLQRCVQ